jgi:hypothetical protein
MQDDTIDIHIRAAGRPGFETERLLADLSMDCWPGGTADQTSAAARGWLRYFRAIRPLAPGYQCTCRDGNCLVCN